MREEIFRFIRKGDLVLDVGCGSGRFLAEIVESTGATGVGVDPYVDEYRGKNLKFFRMRAEDVHKLPFKFDVAFTVHSFHHFYDPVKFLKNVKKVLRRPGLLIIIDWIKGADTGIPERYYDEDEFRKMLQNAGFRIEEVKRSPMEILIVSKKEEEHEDSRSN